MTPHVVEGGRRVLQHVEFVEHDLRLRQDRAHGVEIRPMHIRADGFDRGALARIQALGQQCGQDRFRAVLRQPDHFATDQIRKHRPEALPFAALDLVGAELPGAGAWAAWPPRR